MKPSRRPDPPVTPRERVVGEEQWQAGRGPTLREFLENALVWACVGTSLVLLFFAGMNAFIVNEPVIGWAFYGRVVGLSALLIFAWVAISRPFSRLWFRTATGGRVGLVALLAAAGVGSALTLGATVREVPIEPEFLEIGGRFEFGPYPDGERMAELAERGFDGVISVLEPAGDPEEAALLRQEIESARRAGLELRSFPLFDRGELLPESLAGLAGVIAETDRTYYVHGLTEDSRRLELIRRLLFRLGGRRPLLSHSLEEGTKLERGPVYELDPDIHLMPFPTDAELLEHVVATPVRTVVTLLDPEVPEDRRWIEWERRTLELVDIELVTAPVPPEPYDPASVLEGLDIARTADRPLVVQTFLTPSLVSDAVRQAWATGHPPLPARVFEESLGGGPVRVVAGHVAVGPRPVGREFGWLHRRGVRSVAAFGGLPEAQRSTDRGLSDVAGLEWYFLGGDVNRLLERLASGGPWYVYGGDVEGVGASITERFGAPLTESDVGGEGSTEQQQE